MVMKRWTKTLAALLCAVLLGSVFALSALAAGEDITERLREALQNEVASVTLYTPTERFSSCGEILYSDVTGAMQLSVSGEDAVPLLSVSVSGESAYTPSAADDGNEDTTESWDGEMPYVKAGYVLVTLRAEGRDDYTACLAEELTLTADERAARREAEETESLTAETETAPETTEPTATPSAEATPEPVVEPAAEKKILADRLGEMSGGFLALLIAVMVFGVAVLCELVLLMMYKRRAENVAKNYLRSKAALDANKRELSAARSKNLRLERELMQEREKMAAVREELEKLKNVRPKPRAQKPAPDADEPPRKKTAYDLDYLNWTQ